MKEKVYTNEANLDIMYFLLRRILKKDKKNLTRKTRKLIKKLLKERSVD